MMDDRLAESIWRSAVESAGLKEYDAILRAAARPCFRIGRLIGDIYAQVGNSRFGGKPDLPAGLAWPLDDGAAMTFLAQINLAELEPGFVPDLPAQGWLYFFLGRDGQWGALPHQVVYFAGSAAELHRQGPPAGTPLVEAVCPRNFAPHKVDFVPQYAIKFESPVWKQISLHPFSVESMRKKEAFYQEHTQISGYELTFNGEPARNAYFSRHNVEEPFYSRHETDEHIVAAINDGREQIGRAHV